MEVDSPNTICRKRKRDDNCSFIENYEPDVGIIFDKNLFSVASKLPKVEGRAEIVHGLINAYNIFSSLKKYPSEPANDRDLLLVHSSEFLSYVESINTLYTPDDETELEYGIGYDCPPLDGIHDYIKAIAGSTLTAARKLINGTVDVMINWCGGWHHAQRDQVEGLCYVNDIVLGIIELRNCFDKVLYVDLDVHHGNGVENSFSYTKKVMTVSFHKYEPGYYPGSGDVSDIGDGKGKYFAVNVPLKDGIKDDSYCRVFESVISAVLKKFSPDAVVVQCGADGISGDPLGGFNLTPKALGYCVKWLVNLRKPTLVLGGGGYDIPNTARCWTYITSQIVGCDIGPDIPECEVFSNFAPYYELEISPSFRKDQNSQEYLSNVVDTIKKNLEMIEESP